MASSFSTDAIKGARLCVFAHRKTGHETQFVRVLTMNRRLQHLGEFSYVVCQIKDIDLK
jgi:hypothetical protein